MPVDPFLGEIVCIPFDWAPQGWALCHGQVLPIRDYQALYSVIGTRYGGDGINTFALPDLRGRVSVGAGPGPNQRARQLGQKGGTESGAMPMPAAPATPQTARLMTVPATDDGNMPPFTVLNFMIAVYGTYPARP